MFRSRVSAIIFLSYLVLVGEAWLYPRVNVVNTVHLSKHHSYCLQSEKRGRKDRPPERHLIANDRAKRITNTMGGSPGELSEELVT